MKTPKMTQTPHLGVSSQKLERIHDAQAYAGLGKLGSCSPKHRLLLWGLILTT